MGYLGQSSMGAVSGGGQPSIRDALARLLATLESLPSEWASKKFLPSDNDQVLLDEPSMRSIVQPTFWEASNVVVWPVGDWNALEAAWNAAVAALGIKTGEPKAFALQRNLATATSTRTSALDATRQLLALYDAKFGASGIPWWMWLVVVGAVGAVYAASPKTKKAAARKPRKRLFKRRVTRTFY